jgi:DNA-binding MarR family transcriptional regulator
VDRGHADSSRPARTSKRATPTRCGMKDLVLNLDETVLSRPRLSILAALVTGDAVDFTFLQKNLGISDGNLSTHLRKLEAENYIRSEKVLVNRKPKTWFQITADGRRALERLFRQLEELLTQAG